MFLDNVQADKFTNKQFKKNHPYFNNLDFTFVLESIPNIYEVIWRRKFDNPMDEVIYVKFKDGRQTPIRLLTFIRKKFENKVITHAK